MFSPIFLVNCKEVTGDSRSSVLTSKEEINTSQSVTEYFFCTCFLDIYNTEGKKSPPITWNNVRVAFIYTEKTKNVFRFSSSVLNLCLWAIVCVVISLQTETKETQVQTYTVDSSLCSNESFTVWQVTGKFTSLLKPASVNVQGCWYWKFSLA